MRVFKKILYLLIAPSICPLAFNAMLLIVELRNRFYSMRLTSQGVIESGRVARPYHAYMSLAFVIIVLVITAIYIFIYLKLKLDKPLILYISFILAPLPVFIYEYMSGPSWLQYVGALAVTFWFSVPCLIITTILHIIFVKKRNHKNKIEDFTSEV